jgi:hypothetical protein
MILIIAVIIMIKENSFFIIKLDIINNGIIFCRDSKKKLANHEISIDTCGNQKNNGNIPNFVKIDNITKYEIIKFNEEGVIIANKNMLEEID